MLLYTSTFEIVLHNFSISKLRNAISKSCNLGYAIGKLLKLGCVISKLVSNFVIFNLRSAISNLRKFTNCTEHIHSAKGLASSSNKDEVSSNSSLEALQRLTHHLNGFILFCMNQLVAAAAAQINDNEESDRFSLTT